MNRYILLAGGLLLLTICSCKKSNTNPFRNEVYFSRADTSVLVKVGLDKTESYYNLPIRSSGVVDDDVNVSVTVSEEVLKEYNRKNGTEFKLLPEAFYSFSEISTVISNGNAIASPLSLKIKPLGGENEGVQFAIPVTISNSDLPISQSSKTLILLLDRVIYTSVPYFEEGQSAKVTFKEPFNNLPKWTIEWRIKVDAVSVNNQTHMSLGPDEIYIRYGDVVINPTQLQVKTAGTQFSPLENFSADVWYNFALVYDGALLKWYRNGILIMNEQLSKVYNLERIYIAGGRGSKMLNEVRLWSEERTPTQIANSFYFVDPDSPGLLGYWKCNDGAGNVLKDATANSNDLVSDSDITWVENVRMPAAN